MRWDEVISSFFYTGKFPKAPGTFTSFITALLIFLTASFTGYWLLLIIGLGLSLIGIIVSGITEKRSKEHDPGWITIDEAVGMILSLSLIDLSALPVFQRIILILIAFIMFRLLDILKPTPIRQIQALKGGWGIMADDIIAGIMANLISRLFFYVIFKVELRF
ncbi:phosphatidylglycerophosphatase A [bacterium]|nr:phosphatidylglycerophosphatase A [bacterium]